MAALGLRSALPHLLHHVSAPAPTLVTRLAAKPIINSASSTSQRLFTTTTRAQFTHTSYKQSTNPIFSNLVKRFSQYGGKSSSTAGSRGVATSPAPRFGQSSGELPIDWTRVATSAGIAAVGVVGLNYFLNRETRGGLSAFEQTYLNSTFKWTGAGLVITAATAKLLHGNGTAARMMALNPWVCMGVGLVASIGSMMGVFYTAPDSPAHYACWALFSAVQGVTLSPMFFINPAILSRAGLYTVGALGGLCWVGATAKSEEFLWIGGPLLAGLGVLIVASLAPMILPRSVMTVGRLSVLEHVTAYGGVAVFSGFILYDTQKILRHAQLAQQGRMSADPIRESVSLILDAINLFVRIVQVMLLQQRKRK